jgi:NDP-sugar pyrophosphorylase family protein
MQIIIPMSGFGERFRRAGYSLPKPLIPVDGKPIIAHVIDMFPDETDFIFICNKDHLAVPEYEMSKTLRQYCPTGKIVPIDAHKLGPVNAVLQAREHINQDSPVIVNYCDFTQYWDYEDFKSFTQQTRCDGALPCYRGFHPHSLGSTFYAYVRHDDFWMTDIQEKQPYTDDPTDEYASSGTYYFASGALCLEALDAQMSQELTKGGEYYVSLAYKPLLAEKKKIAIYDIQHFMQWGTPADLEDYLNWSAVFRRLLNAQTTRARQSGYVLLPMAGLGSRFAKEGYTLPKPLIHVSGRPMVLQAVNDLPVPSSYIFVTRADLMDLDVICEKLRTSFLDMSTVVLNGPTEGQAITCLMGLEDVDLSLQLTIGACDNGMLYDAGALEGLMRDSDIDLIVWIVRGHPDGIARPEMFGWVGVDDAGNINALSVKSPLNDPRTDPMIVGTFSFKQASQFKALTKSLIAKNSRINGEFYVDSLIAEAMEAGLKCKIFEIDAYIGWGTPNDIKIFEYWQSCFHKWASHPYALEKDSRIPPSKLGELASHYQKSIPPRPEL